MKEIKVRNLTEEQKAQVSKYVYSDTPYDIQFWDDFWNDFWNINND